MIRLRALNEDSSEESQGEEEIPAITREAQEQTAFLQYNKALLLLREQNIQEAKRIFQELLISEFLVKVSKEECSGQPLMVLKYSCLRNLASILEQEDKEKALEHYLLAADLDSSDVHLWLQIGSVAIKLLRYEFACEAFLEGLRCSPWHASCLDNLVTIFYVLNDYASCLLHIAFVFKQDPGYVKGLAFRDKILKEQPTILQDLHLLYYNYDLGSLDEDYDREIGKQMVDEALALRDARRSLIQELFTLKGLQPSSLIERPTMQSWLAVGQSILAHYKYSMDNNKSLCTPIILDRTEAIPVDCTQEDDKDKKPIEAITEVASPMLSDKTNKPDEWRTESAVDSEIRKKKNEWQQCDGPPPSTADQLYEPMDTSVIPDEENKRRKRRHSNKMSFCAQWACCGKHHPARVRSTVRREAVRDDLNVTEALSENLRRLVPPTLLPNTFKRGRRKSKDQTKASEDSLDTMDLYKLFENRENIDVRGEDKNYSEQKLKIEEVPVCKEKYFGTKEEMEDVENFMNRHRGCDFLEMLIQYVCKLGQLFDWTWPRQLTRTFLEAYKCMRLHVPYPTIFCSEQDWEVVLNDSWTTLLYEELALDVWREEKSSNKNPSSIPIRPLPMEALNHLLFMSSHRRLNIKFRLRVFWLKANSYLSNSNLDVAMQSLQVLMEHFEEDPDEKIVLTNLKYQNCINSESVKSLLKILTRHQNVSELQNLYQGHRYENIVEILQETFHGPEHPAVFVNPCVDNSPGRESQLAMLMDALWQMKRYKVKKKNDHLSILYLFALLFYCELNLLVFLVTVDKECSTR